jgi:uncharacterized protein YbjT (DUF2867 family)
MGSKLITVIGATGAQGGGLARAILRDAGNEDLRLRAVTRNPDSAKARAMAEQGAEVVTADIDDADSLLSAFAGAYGAYCVTSYWEHQDPAREDAQARSLADAARRAGLRHVIWSTLEDTRCQIPLDDDRMPTLLGKYKVTHFDVKGEADHYFRDFDVPTTFLHPPFYWDNFAGMFPPGKGADGTLTITMPMGDKKLAGIVAEDIGKCAYGVFERGAEFIDRSVGIAGEHLTVAQIAGAMSTALGREVVYNAVTPAAYRSLDIPGADELGNMFQYYAEFEEEFTAAHDPDLARSLNPDLQTFDGWLQRNASRIPLP